MRLAARQRGACMLLLFRGVSQRDTVHGSNDNIHGYRSVNTLPSVYAASDLSFTFSPPPSSLNVRCLQNCLHDLKSSFLHNKRPRRAVFFFSCRTRPSPLPLLNIITIKKPSHHHLLLPLVPFFFLRGSCFECCSFLFLLFLRFTTVVTIELTFFSALTQ